MTEPRLDAAEFRRIAEDRLAALADHGFRRAPTEEIESPTLGTVVYVGTHVAFLFDFDVRDQVAGAHVVRVRAGRLFGNHDGGYGNDLWYHFVQREGYRGIVPNRHRVAEPTLRAKVISDLDDWLDFIRDVGRRLLLDRPDSLPLR